MLVALHPNPATSSPLDRLFAAGQGTVSVGRVEQNVISAINLNSNATHTLPEKLVNMVGAALALQAGRLPLLLCGATEQWHLRGRHAVIAAAAAPHPHSPLAT